MRSMRKLMRSFGRHIFICRCRPILQHLEIPVLPIGFLFSSKKILIKYILSRGGKVTLAPIDKVQTEWSSPLAAFEDTLAHEKKVTSMINNLYALAEEEKDYATKSMLGWFIDEQVEEEETAQGYIDALKMIKDNGFGIYTLDKELGARTYTQAAPLAGK